MPAVQFSVLCPAESAILVVLFVCAGGWVVTYLLEQERRARGNRCLLYRKYFDKLVQLTWASQSCLTKPSCSGNHPFSLKHAWFGADPELASD